MTTTNDPIITATVGIVSLTKLGGRGLQIVALDWRCNSSGVVTAVLTGVGGRLLRMTAKPDKSGTQPTNSYGITLKDFPEESDVLGGAGANLSNTANVDLAPMLTGSKSLSDGPMVCNGNLTLNISAAGNEKAGILYLYFEKVYEHR